jgi:hypothetical protein
VQMRLVTDECVRIPAKLRKIHPWVEKISEPIKEAAVKKRRQAERARGVELTLSRLRQLVDELDHVQQQLNPLERRREEIVEHILVHWGYTGIQEVEGTSGSTLLSTSFEMGLDPTVVREDVGEARWRTFTERILQAPLLFVASSKQEMRATIEKSLRVRKLRVSVTPPSSRRPKSGETEGEE